MREANEPTTGWIMPSCAFRFCFALPCFRFEEMFGLFIFVGIFEYLYLVYD